MGGIISQPKVTVNIVPASQAVENTEQKILFIGQKTSSGNAIAGELVENILNDNSEDILFGEQSMIAAMVRNAKNQNPITQMDAIPIDDAPTGISAFTSLWILGTAAENGVLTFNLASKQNHSYRVDVAKDDTQQDILNKFLALYAADQKRPMVGSFVGTAIGSLFSGAEVDDKLSSWTPITDGSFRISIDGVQADITGLDFSLDTTMDDVAFTIENGLNVPLDPVYSGTTVFWSPLLKQFQIFAAGAVIGTVSFTTNATLGTPISALMKTDQAQAFSNQPSINLDLDAVNAGTYGNDFSYSIEGSVAGVKAEWDPFNDGATDPDLTNIFDVVGNKRYQTIIWPYTGAVQLSILQAFLDPRFNADNAVLDGVGITAEHDIQANLINKYNIFNDQNLVVIGDKSEIAGPTITDFYGASQLEISAVKASEFGAIRALRLTDGASISRFVITTNGPLDSFGGPALASKPYFNTETPDLPVIPAGKGWLQNEIDQLKDAGVSVLGENNPGNAAIMGEIVTTYKNDSAGNPDVSFKFLNYVDTASNSREYFFNNLKARFSQSRLTEGDVLPGRDMANALTIINYCEKLYQDLSGPDFVLLQDGEIARDFFRANISVVLDLALGRATVQMTVPLVTQLREILVTMKIAFSTAG